MKLFACSQTLSLSLWLQHISILRFPSINPSDLTFYWGYKSNENGSLSNNTLTHGEMQFYFMTVVGCDYGGHLSFWLLYSVYCWSDFHWSYLNELLYTADVYSSEDKILSWKKQKHVGHVQNNHFLSRWGSFLEYSEGPLKSVWSPLPMQCTSRLWTMSACTWMCQYFTNILNTTVGAMGQKV